MIAKVVVGTGRVGRMLVAKVLLGIASLATVAMLAATPASAQQPSANAVAAARDLIEAKGGTKMFDPVISGVIEQGVGMLLQTNPALYKDLQDVSATLRAELLPRRAELITQMATLYAQSFSEAELKEAIAFYRSPLGKKITEVEPKVLDQGFVQVQQWASKLSEEVLVKLRAEMKKKGHNL